MNPADVLTKKNLIYAMNPIYLYATPDGPIHLIEGDKMPEGQRKACGGKGFCCDYNVRCAALDYDDKVKAAKESSVPIQDQDAAWRVIHPDIKLAKNFKVNDRGSLSYQIGNHHFERQYISDTIYGPFTVGYEIEFQWRPYSTQNWQSTNEHYWQTVGLVNHCAEKRKVAILYDDTPEKEESWVDDPVFSVMEIARMESMSAVERYGMIKEKFTITRK